MRDPEERNPRIGGMTARGDATLVIFGALKETGGRDDLRLSSDLAASTVLGRSSSRWPCAQSFVALSEATRRGCVKIAPLPEGVPFDSAPESTGARCCCGLTTDVAFARFPTVVGESGKDAGRLEEDAAVKELAGDVTWKVEALILEGLRCDFCSVCDAEAGEDFSVLRSAGDEAGVCLLRWFGLLFWCGLAASCRSRCCGSGSCWRW